MNLTFSLRRLHSPMQLCRLLIEDPLNENTSFWKLKRANTLFYKDSFRIQEKKHWGSTISCRFISWGSCK